MRRGPVLLALALILLLSVCLPLALKLRGQADQTFAGGIDLFPKELKEFIQRGTKPVDSLQDAYEAFEKGWTAAILPAPLREEVYSLSKKLVNPTMRSSTYFREWMYLLNSYLDGTRPYSELQELMRWMESGLTKRLNAQKHLSLLRDCAGAQRGLSLHSAAGFTWRGVGAKAQLNIEKGIISYNGVDLVCKRGKDSIAIFATSGEYNPYSYEWKGTGGEIRWMLDSIPYSEQGVRLAHYGIDMSKSEYKVDTVIFWNKKYFDGEHKGSLHDKLVQHYAKQQRLYPSVRAYGDGFRLKTAMEGVSIDAGCMMQGQRMVALGTIDKPVQISLLRNDSLFIRMRAMQTVLTDDALSADNAEVTLFIKQDSLHHSALRFSYYHPRKELTLATTKDAITKAPMYSSFHRMELYFEEMRWTVGTDRVIICGHYGATSSNAYFRSDTYFREYPFDRLQGTESYHPVMALVAMTGTYGNRILPIPFVAQQLRATLTDARHLLLDLAKQGYLRYDAKRQEVTVLDRAFHSVNARMKQVDYDALEFVSDSVGYGQANAVIDLASADINVYRVPKVSVSESQNVAIYPKGRYIKLQKNRGIQFDGQVDVGYVSFWGDSIQFDYDNYTLDLLKVDSVELSYQGDMGYDGKPRRIQVTSKLEELTGFVNIDEPDNKSGLRQSDKYPIFKCSQPAKVYYNKRSKACPGTGGATYDKDALHFDVDTFTFVGINAIKREQILFPGMRVSPDSLFGSARDTLELIVADNSLGLKSPTPAGGMPVYGGKVRLYGSYTLSNCGMHGEGEVTYLSATTKAQDFIFATDTMRARSDTFTLRGRNDLSASYSDVRTGRQFVSYAPASDKFRIGGGDAFDMYNGEATFDGYLDYSDEKLRGSGKVAMVRGGKQKAELAADSFRFENRKWGSDSMNLRFFAEKDQSLAFTASGVKGTVDYDRRSGELSSVSSSIRGQCNAIKYEVLADSLFWPLDQDLVRFSTVGVQEKVAAGEFRIPRSTVIRGDSIISDSAQVGSVFYSVVPMEDSLCFTAPYATYAFSDPHLKADGVRYLAVADARIYPDAMKVEVRAEERMLPLANAEVYASARERRHRFYQADLVVAGGNSYAGKATIDYKSDIDPQPLRLDTIYSVCEDCRRPADRARSRTMAKVNIPDSAEFQLSSKFRYAGSLTVDARSDYHTYEGRALPIYDCYRFKPQWLAFKSRLNPDSLVIPYKAERILANDTIASGAMMMVTSSRVAPYMTFVSSVRSRSDRALQAPEGFMMFDKQRSRYVVADAGELRQPDTVLRRIELDPSACRLFHDGPVTMPYTFPRIALATTGNAIYDGTDTTLTARLFADFQFLFSEEALKMITDDLAQIAEADNFDQRTPNYLHGLRARLPFKEYHQISTQVDLFGAAKDAVELKDNTIAFADLQMRWDYTTNSFVSQGKLPIVFVAGKYVGKRVNGYVEFKEAGNIDRFTIYLELAPDRYYLFTYNGTKMLVNSHSSLFTQVIEKTKSGRRKLKAKGNLQHYEYAVGTTMERDDAQARYRALQVRR